MTVITADYSNPAPAKAIEPLIQGVRPCSGLLPLPFPLSFFLQHPVLSSTDWNSLVHAEYALDPMGGGEAIKPEILAKMVSELAKRPYAFTILSIGTKRNEMK